MYPHLHVPGRVTCICRLVAAYQDLAMTAQDLGLDPVAAMEQVRVMRTNQLPPEAGILLDMMGVQDVAEGMAGMSTEQQGSGAT